MISLARGAAIPGVHTSFTYLETDITPLPALSVAGVCRHSIHDYSQHLPKVSVTIRSPRIALFHLGGIVVTVYPTYHLHPPSLGDDEWIDGHE